MEPGTYLAEIESVQIQGQRIKMVLKVGQETLIHYVRSTPLNRQVAKKKRTKIEVRHTTPEFNK